MTEEAAIKAISKIAIKGLEIGGPVVGTLVGVAAVVGIIIIACKKSNNQSKKEDEDMSFGNKKGTAKQN